QSFSDSEQTLKILRDTIEDVLENKRKKEIFYPIAHIPVHELITFKDRYHYLSELSKSPILYVNEKRFEYDYKIAVDNDFNTNIKFNTKYKQIKALLKKWPMNKQLYDLRAQKETDSMKNLLQDKEREINTQKNCFLSNLSQTLSKP
ncbi:MAG: hypothetical protein EBT45_08215, partial [Alphaproteobacteria bacterium]|nr:hypothetical protein [Alphaproteobacteria bacterium]